MDGVSFLVIIAFYDDFFCPDKFASARIDLLLGFMFFDYENFGTAGYEIYSCGFLVYFQSR